MHEFQFLDGSTALIPLPRRISKTRKRGRLANKQQHRIEEIDDGIQCAKQTCLKLTAMQPGLPNPQTHLRRAQLLPGAQQLRIAHSVLSIELSHAFIRNYSVYLLDAQRC